MYTLFARKFLTKIDFKSLILNSDLRYHFNPFGNLQNEELALTLSPRHFTEQIVRYIDERYNGIIELAGRKGRGKTSHLQFIHQHFQQFPLIMLHANSNISKLNFSNTALIFVDSIQHLPFYKRMRLYRQTRTIVLTTHFSRRIEYSFAGRANKQFRFRGSDAAQLEMIIRRRVQLATQVAPESIQLNTDYIEKLAGIYADDHRSLLNDLYDAFRKD